jgi:hypothetical protein
VIRFLAPWAAAGAILLAGPLLIHMLLRRNARHVLFPATRFLVATPAAAVRFRRPSDIGLLVLRLAIVAAAILAVAHPVVITPWRAAQWDARTVRAVILDTSGGLGQSAEAARLADQELAVFHAHRFATADLRDGLQRAATWLEDAPPGRREVVIVSDFQKGAVDADDLGILPVGAGIRTIRAPLHLDRREVRWPAVGGFRSGSWQPLVRLDANGTNVSWTRTGDTAAPSWLTTAQSAGESDAAQRAVDAALSAGTAAGDDTHRVLVRFAGAPPDTSERGQVRTGWMVEAALALRRSPLLRQTNALVQCTERGGQLIVNTTVAATAIDAPAVVRAVVVAVRPTAIADRNAEVLTVSDAELATWRREPAAVRQTPERLHPGFDSDARWFWALALALLGGEAWLRRRHDGSGSQQVRDAA